MDGSRRSSDQRAQKLFFALSSAHSPQCLLCCNLQGAQLASSVAQAPPPPQPRYWARCRIVLNVHAMMRMPAGYPAPYLAMSMSSELPGQQTLLPIIRRPGLPCALFFSPASLFVFSSSVPIDIVNLLPLRCGCQSLSPSRSTAEQLRRHGLARSCIPGRGPSWCSNGKQHHAFPPLIPHNHTFFYSFRDEINPS